MLLTQCVEFLLIVLSSTLFSLSLAEECTDRKLTQTKLDTWEKFDLAVGEQMAVAVSIPDGYLQNNAKKEIEKQNTAVKNTSLTTFSSTPFSWRLSISIDGASPDNPVLVLVKDGKTEKSFKMPYTRTKDRSKTAITVPFSARSMDLCPLEEITPDSVLEITLYSSSNKTVEVSLKAELTTPWLDWKEFVGEKKFESKGTLTLSSPVVKKSFFSPSVVNNDESVLITIETLPGSDCFCNLVSIQQPSCPYFDSISSAIR